MNIYRADKVHYTFRMDVPNADIKAGDVCLYDAFVKEAIRQKAVLVVPTAKGDTYLWPKKLRDTGRTLEMFMEQTKKMKMYVITPEDNKDKFFPDHSISMDGRSKMLQAFRDMQRRQTV